jgi:hypothetical protein
MPVKLPFRPRGGEYPPDLWTRCPACDEMLYNKQLEKNLRVCAKCGHHFRLRVDARLAHLLDVDSFEEHDAGLESVDPLEFVTEPYPERLARRREATGLRDAAVWGTAPRQATRSPYVMDFAFMGGLGGPVVGERTRPPNTHSARLALVIVSASGGARMQEGTLALMRLARPARRWRAWPRPARAVRERDDRSRPAAFASYAARRRQPGRTGCAHRLPWRPSAAGIAERCWGFGAQSSSRAWIVDQVVARADLRTAWRCRLSPAAHDIAVRHGRRSLRGVRGFNPLGLLGGDRGWAWLRR